MKTQFYKKGGNEGVVDFFPNQKNEKFLATTAVKSRWFKTLKGAEAFMNREGYARF